MAILMCHRQRCMPPHPYPPGPEPQIYYLSTDELFNSGENSVHMDEPNPNQVSAQMQVHNEIVADAENLNEARSTVTTSSTRLKSKNPIKIRVYPSKIETEAAKFDFKIVRIRDENGTVKRCMKCLICSRIVKTVTMARVKSHRYII